MSVCVGGVSGCLGLMALRTFTPLNDELPVAHSSWWQVRSG